MLPTNTDKKWKTGKTDNELIAEFMGLSKTTYGWYITQIGAIHPNLLRYAESWDWLMPACKKFDQLYTGKEAPVGYVDHCDKIDNAVSCYEIDWAFEALVNGIKWYNQNTQNH